MPMRLHIIYIALIVSLSTLSGWLYTRKPVLPTSSNTTQVVEKKDNVVTVTHVVEKRPDGTVVDSSSTTTDKSVTNEKDTAVIKNEAKSRYSVSLLIPPSCAASVVSCKGFYTDLGMRIGNLPVEAVIGGMPFDLRLMIGLRVNF